MLRLVKFMTKTISVLEIVNVEKEICGTFAVAPQTAKVMTTVCGKCLVRIEKALNL